MTDVGDELLDLAARLAREAGALVAAGRRGGVRALSTKSTLTDMVTEFDQASERLIVERLTVARPDDGIVGEEGTATEGTTGIDWLIDPIDGTTNFLYDLPGYAVSIAAVDHEGTLVGVVYVPALDELFAARRGGGATLDGNAIRCGERTDVGSALVGTGFSYFSARRSFQADRVARLIPHVRDIRRLGAASVDLCYVAMGRLDAYFEEHLGPWDLAAGELIAREAGCRTGDFRGGPPRPDEVLVANPTLFPPLADLILDAS
jgi:myo-inositol-1(or 4)-monophosphatase